MAFNVTIYKPLLTKYEQIMSQAHNIKQLVITNMQDTNDKYRLLSQIYGLLPQRYRVTSRRYVKNVLIKMYIFITKMYILCNNKSL